MRALARRYGVSPTKVQKWRKRQTVTDERMGPKEARSTVLAPEEEAIILGSSPRTAFRRDTLLPLDDCLYGFQPTIPHLTRSSLHRWLERHGISHLPDLRQHEAHVLPRGGLDGGVDVSPVEAPIAQPARALALEPPAMPGPALLADTRLVHGPDSNVLGM